MNLTSADIARMRDTEIISTLERLEQDQARLDAHKIHALARLHQLRQGKKHGHGKYVGDEVAAALHWSPTTATNKVNTAVSLVHRLPDTVAALERGELDLPKVHAIHDWTAPLSKHHARQVAAVVQDWAAERTVSAVRAKLSREVHKIDPQGAEAPQAGAGEVPAGVLPSPPGRDGDAVPLRHRRTHPRHLPVVGPDGPPSQGRR